MIAFLRNLFRIYADLVDEGRREPESVQEWAERGI